MRDDKWAKARAMLSGLNTLEADWDGAGAAKPDCHLVFSAGMLLAKICVEGIRAPNDVYVLPDGTVLLEWHYPDKTILRVGVENCGEGDMFVTAPGQQARFRRIRW